MTREEREVFFRKLAENRKELVQQASDETLEAFDVMVYFRYADDCGLPVEWFETFLHELKQGTPPVEAAFAACMEWDIA